MSSVTQSFNRIMAWAKARLPLLADSIRPGASAAEIASLEALVGQRLPDDVRELYALADGQTPFQPGKTSDYPGLFFGLPFNSIEKVKSDWRLFSDLAADEELNDAELHSSFPPDAVKHLYFSRGWIALSDDSGGNYMGVDLDPGPRGNAGQWIVFGRDEDEKLRVASSLSAFLSWMADEVDQGRTIVQSGAAAEESGPWLWRDGKFHFHDAVREYLKAGGKIG